MQSGVQLFLHYGDLTDSTNLFHIVSTVRPHELYNLGAMSHVAVRGDSILIYFFVIFSHLWCTGFV